MSALPLAELITQPLDNSSSEPVWLSQQRQLAAKRLQATGLPAEGSENWRYSSLRSLLKKVYLEDAEVALDEQQLLSQTGLQAGDYRMIFINGRYQAQLSLVPPDVSIRNLASVLAEPELEAMLSQVPEALDSGFSWLNTMTFTDGLFVRLKAGQSLTAPLHFIQVSSGSGQTNSRHVISLAAAAKLTLIEQFIEITDMPPAQGLLNSQIDVELADSARLDWSRSQSLGASAQLVDRLNCKLGKNSHFHSTQLDTGGQWVRHDVDVRLDQPGGFVKVNGVVMVRGRQHCDIHTRIIHAAENCTSREMFKYLADGRSRAVFNGKVIVLPGADGTDSAQRSDNLLLSEHARIDTKPDLEIHTDDVIASHGATVGQLDEDALFYLRSRGIDMHSARRLLMRAFSQQVIEQQKDKCARAAFELKLDEIFVQVG